MYSVAKFAVSSLLILIRNSRQCGAGTGTLQDAALIQDPTFTFSVSPPVGWTYPGPPPANTGVQTVTYFFPGQMMSSEQAVQRAQSEIQASFFEAMQRIPFVTMNAEVQVTYSPDEISNCYTTLPFPAGIKIGYLAAGAITEYILANQQTETAVSCPIQPGVNQWGMYQEYIKDITVSAKNTPLMSRYEWERVANQMMSSLAFRYHAMFRSPVIISQ